MATINCDHCGKQVPSKRPKQQRWCYKCKALKSIIALSRYPAKCRVCAKPYYKRDRHDILCYACDAVTRDPGASLVDCKICGTSGKAGLAKEGIPLCLECCADPNPKTHNQVLGAAVRGLERAPAEVAKAKGAEAS